ncbi:MAG: flagellar hook-associated protein FlgK [Bdellovibrionales bacterium]|nr:flagellar hook-associated protein FlgK [Bdellovibrionales bacterium]
MSKIGSVMTIGKRSMMNSQNALQTVSHNIANKDTEGFSRQRVEITTSEPTGFGQTRMGQGAYTKAVRRIQNPFLEKQIQTESNELGFGEGQTENLSRVEEVFNEQVNKGLNRFLSDFFNAFRELANNPENTATRTLVKETAEFATQDFKRVNRQLTDIQKDIDQQLISNISEINGMLQEVASLNQKIELVENTGAQANDERDRRDLLLKNLSKFVNIRWGESDTGQVTVTAGNTAVLVSGYEASELKAVATPEREGKREGRMDIMYKASQGKSWVNVTKQLTGGTIGGAIDVRDNVVNGLLDRMDDLAYTMVKNVNAIHQRGYNLHGQTGVQFFSDLGTKRDASEMIDLNHKIYQDVSSIATAAIPNAPGDNRIANVISNLQYQKILDNDKSTFDDAYNGMVGELAVVTKKSRMVTEHQNNIVSQLNKVRDSISGVSLDEETVKMIEFQKAFDASARVIRTADEMLDTVLNLKRY